MAIKARWVGNRHPDGSPVEFHEGIPARDLDDEAWEVLTAEQRRAVGRSPLYAVREEPRPSGRRAAKGGD
jgi:hypothetical protein